jgi:peptide/nickel transport system permease protein
LIFDAVTARDHPLLQGAFLLVTLGIVAANALADLTYPLLDPRVRAAGVRS